MTINDQHRAATGTPNGSGPDHEPLSGTHALVDRLHSGEPYAVAFGGQGGPWLENLEELVNSAGIESEISALVGERRWRTLSVASLHEAGIRVSVTWHSSVRSSSPVFVRCSLSWPASAIAPRGGFFFLLHIHKIKNNFKDTANSSKLVIRIEPREEYTNAKSMSMTFFF